MENINEFPDKWQPHLSEWFDRNLNDDELDRILSVREAQQPELTDQELNQLFYGDCDHQDMLNDGLTFCPECGTTMAEVQADWKDIEASR